MDFELPPDPYAALGVGKDASSSDIKKAWQKLVLKCHPDKVTDDAAKAKANEEFHKVQSAYELIGEEASRDRYDAQLRIHELRKQNEQLRSRGPRYDVRTAAFDVRTAAPPPASFTARAPPRFHAEERRPSYFEDEPLPRTTSRKYEAADYAYVKRSAPPKDKERERVRVERVRVSSAEERRKADRRRDADVNESRTRKYETRAEVFAQCEEERRRRDREDNDRRKAAEAPKPSLRREDTYERTRQQEEDAVRYMASRSVQDEARPNASRTSSSRDVPRYEYVRRSSAAETKESTTRRNRGGDSPRGSPPRESRSTRRSQDIVDPYEGRPPTLKPQTSAPPKVSSSKEFRDPPPPQRSYTTQGDYERRKGENEPPPIPFSRSQTMPTVPGASSRDKKSNAAPSSKLRTSESAISQDSGYSSPASPEKHHMSFPPPPPPPSQPNTIRTTYYHPSGNTTTASTNQHDYSNGHRVEVRAPQSANSSARRIFRSPSPLRDRDRDLDRDVKTSTTATKMAHLASGSPRPRPSTFSSYADQPSSRPPFAQTSSARDVPRSSRSPERNGRDRDRDERHRRDRYRDERPREKLYREISEGQYRGQPSSYRPEDISYAKRYTPDDIIYGTKDRSRGQYDERRPALSRSSTAVY